MSKDRLIRCITSDGAVMACAVDTTELVYKASKLHITSPVATAALGRLLTAASIMGAQLKQENASITLRIKGDESETGALIAVSDSKGNVKGYVQNPDCPTEYYPNGKLNVAKAVGKTGILNVMRDYGGGEPYVGQVQLISGEIAEDITNYYATSEQIPTVCALGVLLDKEDHQVLLSGGLLIQLLPGATDETIDKIEQNVTELEPMTTMLAKGMSMEEICQTALKGFEVEFLDETEIKYACSCSREKIIDAFVTLSDDEIRSLADEKGYAEAICHFCKKKHRFSKLQLEQIIKQKHETAEEEPTADTKQDAENT